MENNWSLVSFSDAVNLNPTVRLTKGEEYPFVDMKSVNPAWREVTFSELRVFKSGGAKFIPQDTLMARITPCLENGKIARYLPAGKKGGAFGSTEFIVIRGKDGVTDNDFAYYLTMWSEFREFAISQMTGSSGRQRVPVDSLAGFNFNLPPLTEQKAIAHILGSLDDKIKLNRRMNETLEAMAQALFKSWFVDFDPVVDNALAAGNEIPEELKERAEVRKALGNARKPLSEEIQKLFPSEFEHTEEMGWIPKGWEVVPLSDVMGIKHGYAFKGKSFSTNATTDILLTPGNFKIGGGFKADKFKYYSGDFPAEYILRENNIIVTMTDLSKASDTLGFPAFVPYVDPPNQYLHNQRLGLIKDIDSRIGKSLIYLHLCSEVYRNEVLASASGTTVKHTSPTKILSHKIVLSGTTIEKKFEEIAKELFSKMKKNYSCIEKLSNLRDTLLPQLLSGEIRIPEAEKLVEDLERNGGDNGKS